jgi:hypothetical protein
MYTDLSDFATRIFDQKAAIFDRGREARPTRRSRALRTLIFFTSSPMLAPADLFERAGNWGAG